MIEQLSIYDADIVTPGGDFNPAGYHVGAIGARLASDLVKQHHYLHRRPNVSYCFGLIAENGRVDGVVVFGTPASRSVQVSACPSNPSVVIELSRLWIRDELGRNAESYLVARALKAIPAMIVISYADTAYGHKGIIYRALGFEYAGWTDMDRKSARIDYVTPGRHPRDSFREGSKKPRWTHKETRSTKARYWTITGNRKERHELAKIAAWPSISWKDYPVPNGHQYMPIIKEEAR